MDIYQEIEYYAATGEANKGFVNRLIENLRRRDIEIKKMEVQIQEIKLNIGDCFEILRG